MSKTDPELSRLPAQASIGLPGFSAVLPTSGPAGSQSGVLALQVADAGEPFTRTMIRRRGTGPRDVRIGITYAGICRSDLHQVRDGWGGARFPMVPGHEITGTVLDVGKDVTRFATGDRAGVGCLVTSCDDCAHCQVGHEHLCSAKVDTYNSVGADGDITKGGYSEQIVVDERFVLSIPDELGLAEAAPLLCAGITTYAPLRRFDAANRSVAIAGLGGLGHVGVKIAAAMGSDVTVLSRGLAKHADGLRFGARAVHATDDPETFTKLGEQFDLILNTAAGTNAARYLELLRPHGVLVNIALPEDPYVIPPFSFITRERVITGSFISGIAQTQEMLNFCAEHRIGAEIELFAADDIEAAYQRVESGEIRYRAVLGIAATLTS